MLGFPSNDFSNEEPGTNAEVKRFASSRYGVTFPMFAKIPVIGPNAHPLYKHITTESVPPRWNFHKYLVDRTGQIVAEFDPKIEPDDAELVKVLERLLGDGDVTAS